MHPTGRLSNAPTLKLHCGVYLSKYTEASLREWSKITGQNYNTIKSKFRRLLEKCPYKKESRKDFYKNYLFYKVINEKLPFDNLVLPSLYDFTSKIFWIIKEYLPEGTKHDEFTSRETTRLQDNLDSGLPLGLSLKLMLQENDVNYEPEFLKAIKADYVRDDDLNKESLDMLALRFGQPPKLVRKRLKRKWVLSKALNTVSY